MALQLVRSLLKHSIESGFGRVLKTINITSAGNGQLTAEMKVEEEHTNYLGTLHGGLTATIIDNLSSYALVTYKPNQKRGSSIDMQISINIVSVESGNIVAEMKVEEENTNPFQTLHGGMTATIVDVISSLGHFTHPNGAKPSVSANINIYYLNPANIGDELVITANTIKAGKTLAFLEVKITEKTTGKIIATGSHIKFVKE